MSEPNVDLDALLAEVSSVPPVSSAPDTSGHVNLDALLNSSGGGAAPETPSGGVNIGDVISQLESQNSTELDYSRIPDILRAGSGEMATNLVNFLGGGTDLARYTTPEDFAGSMRNVVGTGAGILTSGLASPVAQTGASQLSDFLMRTIGVLPEKSAADTITGGANEAIKNLGIDALINKFVGPAVGASVRKGRGLVDKVLPSAMTLAKKSVENPKLFAARATGQGAMTSQASMGGFDSAAEFAASSKPWDLGVYQADGFDKMTGKFITKPGKDVTKVGKYLSDENTLKSIAEARNSFIRSLDSLADSAKIKPIDGNQAADELKSVMDALPIMGKKVTSKKQVDQAEVQATLDGFYASLKEDSSFKNILSLTQEADEIIRDAGAYDDAAKLVGQTAPSKLIEEAKAMKVARNALKSMMMRAVRDREDVFGSAVSEKAGITAAEYLDNVTSAYQAARIVGDDLDAFESQMARQGTILTDRALKNESATNFITKPIRTGINAITRGRLENARILNPMRRLEGEIPQYIENVNQIRSGTKPAPTSLQQFWGNSLGILNQVRQPFLRQAIPTTDFMSVVSASLQPEEAQAIEAQLQQAAQSADPLAEERIMGSAVAMFPELRANFAPAKTTANSEWAGLIADPAEKIAIKGKLQQHVQAGEVDSITAAKFAMKLNKDEPFTSVPRPLRGRETQPALPSAPGASLSQPSGLIQGLAPDLAQPLDVGFPSGLPTLQ